MAVSEGRTSRLRAAVIGCGRMGALTTERTRGSVPKIWMPLSHADAISSIDDLQLVAMCDTSAEQVSKAIDAHPGAVGYTDHLEMLDEVRPDVVGIATRTEGRCEIIRDCAIHGVCGIHAEKPLARSLVEAAIALTALREHGVGFTFGAVRRYMAPYVLARDVLQSGEIGELRQIVVEHGSDMLLWGHPHSVDLAGFFCPGKKVSRVQSRLRIEPKTVSRHGVDSDPIVDMAFLEFEHGVSAIITAGHGFNARIYGTSGSVTVVGDGTRVELRHKVAGRPYELEHRDLPFSSTISGTQQAFLNLVSYINDGKATGLSVEDIEQVHRVLFAMAISELERGTAINPVDVPPDFFVSGRFGDLYA